MSKNTWPASLTLRCRKLLTGAAIGLLTLAGGLTLAGAIGRVPAIPQDAQFRSSVAPS